MAGPDIDTALAWRGRTVRDPDGEEIGRFGDVFLDRDGDRPAWGAVRTGLFGRRESLVPLEGVTASGDDLVVPWSGEVVREAPNADPDVALDADEEARLFAHYDVGGGAIAPTASGDAGREATDDPDAATMVRSEEEVTAEPGPMRPSERVRLRKVLVTDEVTKRVPVRKEVVQLEHEPPPEGRVESVEDVDDR